MCETIMLGLFIAAIIVTICGGGGTNGKIARYGFMKILKQ